MPLLTWLCVATVSACGGSYDYSNEAQMIRNERQLRESPDAIESALPSPESRGCVYGTVSTTEAIPTPIADVDVQSFHAGQPVLRARSDASGIFHACVDSSAPEQPWQDSEVSLRIEAQHPDYAPLTLHRTWSTKKPLKLRILMRRVTADPPPSPSQPE